MIKYSIIIPHKNTPDLLLRCLNSIPQRDDVEIIVVDNGSSADIVDFDHYPEKERTGVTIISDPVSKGAGGARNTGLKHAKGKWVLFADADDYYSAGFLEKLDWYCGAFTDVIYFNFIIINNNTIIDYPFGLRFFNDFNPKDTNFQNMMRYRFTAPWNKMVRRDFIQKYDIKFEDCITGNDIFFSYQVGFYAKTIIADNFKLYNYVIHDDSNNHRKNNKEEFYLCLLRHYYQSNEFLKFVGHPEWNYSFSQKFAAIVCKRGLQQFWIAIKIFILNRKFFKERKMDFVLALSHYQA